MSIHGRAAWDYIPNPPRRSPFFGGAEGGGGGGAGGCRVHPPMRGGGGVAGGSFVRLGRKTPVASPRLVGPFEEEPRIRRGGLRSMVWYGMVWYGMVWYGMVWYGMVWYGMVWYGMVWYGMVWYGTLHYTTRTHTGSWCSVEPWWNLGDFPAKWSRFASKYAADTSVQLTPDVLCNTEPQTVAEHALTQFLQMLITFFTDLKSGEEFCVAWCDEVCKALRGIE